MGHPYFGGGGKRFSQCFSCWTRKGNFYIARRMEHDHKYSLLSFDRSRGAYYDGTFNTSGAEKEGYLAKFVPSVLNNLSCCVRLCRSVVPIRPPFLLWVEDCTFPPISTCGMTAKAWAISETLPTIYNVCSEIIR